MRGPLLVSSTHLMTLITRTQGKGNNIVYYVPGDLSLIPYRFYTVVWQALFVCLGMPLVSWRDCAELSLVRYIMQPSKQEEISCCNIYMGKVTWVRDGRVPSGQSRSGLRLLPKLWLRPDEHRNIKSQECNRHNKSNSIALGIVNVNFPFPLFDFEHWPYPYCAFQTELTSYTTYNVHGSPQHLSLSNKCIPRSRWNQPYDMTFTKKKRTTHLFRVNTISKPSS